MKMKISKTVKNKINRYLYLLGFNKWYTNIPLTYVFDKLKEFDLIPLQEDNTEWEGILCGYQASMNVPLGISSSITTDGMYKPSNLYLSFSWYKMPSGKYEIVSYVS
jgi:hypothetical protein